VGRVGSAVVGSTCLLKGYGFLISSALVVLGFIIWLPTDVYLRQAADNLCLQLGLLGLSNPTHLFHLLKASGPPKCDVFHLVDTRSALSVAVQV
jgi:hypothetical protein